MSPGFLTHSVSGDIRLRCAGIGDRQGEDEVERRGFTVRIARWSAEHPWRAMGLWVLFVAASIFMGNVIGTHKAENSGNVGETARAQQMIKDGNFPKEPSTERLLVTSPSGAL